MKKAFILSITILSTCFISCQSMANEEEDVQVEPSAFSSLISEPLPKDPMEEIIAEDEEYDESAEYTKMDKIVYDVQKWAFHALEALKKMLSPKYFKQAEKIVQENYQDEVDKVYPEGKEDDH